MTITVTTVEITQQTHGKTDRNRQGVLHLESSKLDRLECIQHSLMDGATVIRSTQTLLPSCSASPYRGYSDTCSTLLSQYPRECGAPCRSATPRRSPTELGGQIRWRSDSSAGKVSSIHPWILILLAPKLTTHWRDSTPAVVLDSYPRSHI